MLNYRETKEYIYLYINESDKEYPISIAELGSTQSWNPFLATGELTNKTFPNVSKWITHLSEKIGVDEEYLKELEALIKEKAPNNKIDWPATHKAVKVMNEFKSLIHSETDEQPLKPTKINAVESIERAKEYAKVAEQLIKKYNL